MSSPAAVPTDPFGGVGVTTGGLWQSSFTAMASPVRVQLGPDTPRPQRLHAQLRTLFAEVEAQCTRFDADSDLMRANAAGEAWTQVGPWCFAALKAAADAHVATAGRFDPRVLKTLIGLGYSRSLPFAAGDVRVEAAPAVTPPGERPSQWQPGFDELGHRVRIGPDPVDLGGIGKGLALRWAADRLAGACSTYLVDAGGDCVFAGGGPDGSGWRIGIEDPLGGTDPVAVLAVDAGACATSSVRLRTWHAAGRRVHHLIDPATGAPGGEGLAAVTVVGPDPATAEVWSKVLFLCGADIASAAERRELAALWVWADGTIGVTEALAPTLLWQRS